MTGEFSRRASSTATSKVRTLVVLLFSITLLLTVAGFVQTDIIPTVGPTFVLPISNVTVPVGREAILSCVVGDLSNYKVAWLQVNTQTILTIAIHVITKNHRIAVSHSDHKVWNLHIKDVHESDQGDYMCQINTDPMISKVGHLKVVVPPDILNYPTSTDMVVREGNNVTLRCAATGSPMPNITWKRESGDLIPYGNEGVSSVNGSFLNISRVNRLHMGAYLCIASNGVPPTVSKRIMLIVHFPPMIAVQNQLVGVEEGQHMTLECHSEAYPKSINYWTRENDQVISNGDKYESSISDNLHMDAYKVHMKLVIKQVDSSDYGSYKCISKNSLGSTDGTIKLYKIEKSTTLPKTTTTTPMPTVMKVEKKVKPRQKTLLTSLPNFNEIVDDDSKFTEGGKSGAQLRERPKTDAKSERNHEDGEEDGLQRDKTAQSMSSRSTATSTNHLNIVISLFIFIFPFIYN